MSRGLDDKWNKRANATMERPEQVTKFVFIDSYMFGYMF